MAFPPIRVLIADDHQMLIDGLKKVLEDTGVIQCVGTANNGAEVLQILENEPVDVVLLDIQMPIMDGLKTTEKIKKRYKQVKVLALSMYENERHVQRMLKLGASGYLLKNTGKEQLVKAIQAAQQGEVVIDPKISRNFFQKLAQPDQNAFIPQLTRREKEILELIAEEKTTAEIAGQLYITVSTVEYHRKNLLTKFDAPNAVGLVTKALKLGVLE